MDAAPARLNNFTIQRSGGGGAFVDGNVDISGSAEFSDCSAGGGGGGLAATAMVSKGTITFHQCEAVRAEAGHDLKHGGGGTLGDENASPSDLSAFLRPGCKQSRVFQTNLDNRRINSHFSL